MEGQGANIIYLLAYLAMMLFFGGYFLRENRGDMSKHFKQAGVWVMIFLGVALIYKMLS